LFKIELLIARDKIKEKEKEKETNPVYDEKNNNDDDINDVD